AARSDDRNEEGDLAGNGDLVAHPVNDGRRVPDGDVDIDARKNVAHGLVMNAHRIEGQADRQEGKRILGDLPRLQRVEGYLWAPGHGLLDRVSFPPIRTFDSSRTPKRGERIATPRTLAEVALPAIVA